ncbi:hypothetical protein Pelo_10340 [Pelomyxa schiedti]|nr:hypothetical protein Pelo_10340 [Pelomyxa schiedti]
MRVVFVVALVVASVCAGTIGEYAKASTIDPNAPAGATAWLPGWNSTKIRAANTLAAADWKQCYQSYSGNTLGTCSGTSICNAGCAMCSTNDYLTYLKYSGNPGDFNTWLTKNGGYVSGCNLVWATVDNLGYTVFCGIQYPSYSTVCSSVNSGNGIVIWVNNQSHFVLVVGCDGNNGYYTHDPYYDDPVYQHSSVASWSVYHPKATGCY